MIRNSFFVTHGIPLGDHNGKRTERPEEVRSGEPRNVHDLHQDFGRDFGEFTTVRTSALGGTHPAVETLL